MLCVNQNRMGRIRVSAMKPVARTKMIITGSMFACS